MSQVDTQQQSRTQSGRPNSPSANANGGQEKTRQKRQGSGNRQFDENRPPKSRGGDRSDSARGNRGSARTGGRGERPLNKDSKTIYIGKVFTDDLDGSGIATKLKEQRIKYLRDVLDQFGPIESFDAQVNDGYVLLTYETHKAADDALKTLKNRDEVDTIIARVHDKLNQSKLPIAVCPDLHKYRYSWSDKQAPTRTRSAGAKNAPQLPKTVVAKKVSDQQAPSPTTAQQPQQSQQQQQQPKAKKARKGKDQEEQEQAPQPQQTQQQQPKKKSQQQNVQQQSQVVALSPKTQQGADDLQREAERARLTQDLHYLRQQQQHVSQELAAESDRCRARDERINRLSEELSRVRQQEQFLEGQLKAEQNWKQAAEDRIVKLTEEVSHFVQEQKQVEKRLNAVEQQLGSNGL